MAFEYFHSQNSNSNYSMSLIESASSSSSSSNLLSTLATTHPPSPGPLPSDGVMSTNTPLPTPPRHGVSIKNFASREEYLQAMLEDISYWVGELVFLNAADFCTADNFFGLIETGEVLCELANRICECIVRDATPQVSSEFASLQPLTFRRRSKPESFFARDNISTFLQWASTTWHIRQCLSESKFCHPHET